MTQDRGRKRRGKFRRAGIGFAALAAVILSALLLTAGGSWYRLADKGVMALRHLHRQIFHANGWALPGTPDLGKLDERLAAKGLKRGDPVFIRIFKSDLELELWLKKDGRFVHFATYPICFWSGRLGPRRREGDRQAPEGFYTVGRGQLNPRSRWHRSFNLGYPNLFDRAHGRTGAYLMVHGGCSSIGCYAMTNPVVDEIWNLITAALNKGQKRFAVHAFPFRLTAARLAAYRNHPSAAFWQTLKPGYDLFEASRLPPRINVCRKRYTVRPGGNADSASALRAACPNGGAGA
jgi:murein L,D-transpeptidase YafK